jgi:hypothetical protein
MKEKGLLLLLPLVLVLFIVLACGTTPEAPAPTAQVHTEPAPQAAPAPPAAIPEPAPAERVFDPSTISAAQYDAVMEEVRALIEDLNRIIRARNFNAWVDHLSEEYYREISSPAFLEERTEDLFRRDQMVQRNLGRDPRLVQRRVLRTPTDYFNLIVVPSRSNDRVDDIDFVEENRVKAYTVDSRGNRLILYDLEIIDGRWKIVS